MKEIEPHHKTELSVNQQQQKQYELIGEIVPHNGHVIWEINIETNEINKAKFSNATYVLGGENKREVIVKDGCKYVSALNKKNAMKKYAKGKNGTKDIIENPLTL